jgi:anti-sigma factor RsiW
MTCENWRAWLDAYVDECCTPEQLAGIEDHLQSCSTCAAEALARLQLKRATRAAAKAQFIPSPEFRLRLEKTVQKSRKTSLECWMDSRTRNRAGAAAYYSFRHRFHTRPGAQPSDRGASRFTHRHARQRKSRRCGFHRPAYREALVSRQTALHLQLAGVARFTLQTAGGQTHLLPKQPGRSIAI